MEIINDVNGLFEFQDLGARTELVPTLILK